MLKLTSDKKFEAIEEIKCYFQNERDEEIGDLAAMLLLDFIIDKIGPHFYNQGLHDAITFITEKTEDLFGLEKHSI
jgi:uncharacterized protein (DUF2164 family)